MNAEYCIESLAHFPKTLSVLIRNADAHTLSRRGHDTIGWSIVEILCHLADEEVEDFRVRLELTLTDPSGAWPGIDPEGVAVSRAYRQQEPQQALRRFVSAREVNVRWLRLLDAPDWSSEHTHARFGSMRAGDLLASWAAHDWLHLRQITKRLFESVQTEVRPYSTDYAGRWTA